MNERSALRSSDSRSEAPGFVSGGTLRPPYRSRRSLCSDSNGKQRVRLDVRSHVADSAGVSGVQKGDGAPMHAHVPSQHVPTAGKHYRKNNNTLVLSQRRSGEENLSGGFPRWWLLVSVLHVPPGSLTRPGRRRHLLLAACGSPFISPLSCLRLSRQQVPSVP
ncbi:hypothetical protein MRX96_054579 [Rhipicephalus microplus]